MKITQSYKYRKDNIVYIGGEVPEGAEVLETMNILNADDGKELIKNGANIGNSVWLKDGDSQENYAEVEILEPEELPEIEEESETEE
ncbi:MAG: hypothetical protein IIW86_05390 [Clostridia bacterium]|nr:hypothetical protein [Clostridia bacterium]